MDKIKKRKQNSDIIDISGLLQQYRRKWYLFAISVIGCCAIAMFIAKVRKPVYEITANVLIDTGDNDPMAALGMGSLFGATNYVDDEIFIISSHSLYCDVARELGLDRNRVFVPGFMQKDFMAEDYPLDIISPAEFADTAHVKIIVKVKVNDKGLASGKVLGPRGKKLMKFSDEKLPLTLNTIYGDFTVTTTKDYVAGESYKAYLTAMSYDAAAEDLDENIDSYIANKKTHVIRLQYPTDNTAFGVKLIDEVMRQYDLRVIKTKNQQANKTVEFLDARIAELGNQLAGAEGGLQAFKEKNGIIDLSADTKYNLEMKGEVEKQLFASESRKEIARMAYEFLSTPGNEYSLIPFTPADPEATGINALIGSYNGLVMQRMQVMTAAKGDNFQVKNLENQMDAMRGNILASLSKNYETASAIVTDLNQKKNATVSTLSNLPQQERELVDLERDRSLKNRLYMYLLQKREENAMMMANAISKGVVVDEAYVPSESISMSTKKKLVVGFLIGLILPVLFLYTRKLLRGKPESRGEIEGQLDAPILGEISTSRSADTLVVTQGSTSSAAELFKLLRTNLQFILKGKDKKVVMVTSSQSGEGKSFISVNIAAALALLGKKVLIVGLDIRKPMLASYLHLPADHPGLTSYLSDETLPFSQVVQKEKRVPGLDVVTAGIVPPNPAELLLDPRLEEFFREARERYDDIIVDSAPVGMVSDSLSVADFADATVYVTRLGVTTFRDLRFINSLYDEDRLPAMTVVVNGTTATRGYGYGYGSVEDHGKNVHNTKSGFFNRLFGKK